MIMKKKLVKINKEDIIKTLFYIGFSKVNTILLCYIIAKLNIDNKKDPKFEYNHNEEFSLFFQTYFTFEDGYYYFKDGIYPDTMIKISEYEECSIDKYITPNQRLFNYLMSLDYQKLYEKMRENNDYERIGR